MARVKSNVKLITINDIRHLYAQSVNEKIPKIERENAKENLALLTNDLRNTANRRMRDLRKAGYDYGSAYDSSIDFIHSHYGDKALTFHKPQVDTPQQLAETYNEALQALSYLNSNQSTVGQQRAIERDRFKTMRGKIGQAGEIARSMNDNELRDFLRFLGNSSVHDYLSFYEESEDTVNELMAVYSTESMNKKIDDIFSDYEKYLEDINMGVLARDARGKSTYEVRQAIDELYGSSAVQKNLKEVFKSDYENVKRRRR